MRLFLYIFLAIFILGCNTKQKVGYFDTQKNEQQAIINTKKAQFSIGERKFLLSGTYLNPIKSLHLKGQENFLITIYSSHLKNGENIITGAKLNGKIDGIHWEPIKNSNPLTTLSPIANKWNHYFLIKTPFVKNYDLNLTLQIHRIKRVVLNFEKYLVKQY